MSRRQKSKRVRPLGFRLVIGRLKAELKITWRGRQRGGVADALGNTGNNSSVISASGRP